VFETSKDVYMDEVFQSLGVSRKTENSEVKVRAGGVRFGGSWCGWQESVFEVSEVFVINKVFGRLWNERKKKNK
jgi:hypothetical protein